MPFLYAHYEVSRSLGLSIVGSLRHLVDFQQFEELKNSAVQYLNEGSDISVKVLQALACAHLGELSESNAILSIIEDQISDLDIDSQVDLAAVYSLLHRVEDAIKLLENAQKQAPQHALLLARLAWCRLVQEMPHLALPLYQQSAKLDSSRLPVWNALTSLYLQLGDYVFAQQSLNTGIT